MARKAIALHVIEKGKKVVNLRCVDEINGIWETGNWSVSDDTAASLEGGMIYVHKGQLLPSDIGGKVMSFRSVGKYSDNRKIFTFKSIAAEKGVLAGRDGWGNEKKVVWQGEAEPKLQVVLEDEESSFPEGAERYALHKERDRDVVFSSKVKLARLKKTGKLECDVCGFDFSAIYGVRGSGYIEAHHTVPVSQLSGKVKTKISDFALVCANCHRMLHRGPELLSVEQLKAIRNGEA